MEGLTAGHSGDCGGGEGGVAERGSWGDKSVGARVVIDPCSLTHPYLGRINPVHHAASSLVETLLGFLPSCSSIAMVGGHLVTGVLVGTG